MSGWSKGSFSALWIYLAQVVHVGLRIVVVVGLLGGLAGCNKPAIEPFELPARSVPVSAEAAEQLADRLESLFDHQGLVRLSITEEELTSYLAVYGPRDVLQSPAIWLGDGVVQASTRLYIANKGYQLQAVLAVQSQDDGLQICIRQVTLDGKRVPRLLLLGIESAAEAAANDALADLSFPLALSDVSITEGLMVVTGEIH